MQPEDFYELSVDLQKQGSEASLRSASSRAYYSTFHVAREKAKGTQIEKSPRGSHDKVCLQVSSLYGKAAGKLLRTMKNERNQADYDLSLGYSEENVIRMMCNREKLLNVIYGQEGNARSSEGME